MSDIQVSRDDLAHIVDRAREYAEASQASATRRAYAADFRTFTSWCEERGLPSLPTTPATVAVYLAARADAGAKVATIERALAGISDAQRAAGVDWRTNHPAISDTMAGIRRTLGVAPTKKAPVTVDVLAALVSTLGTDPIGRRNRAIVLLGWAGAFRRSELVALTVEDVRRDQQGIVVRVRRSKTDQNGEGHEKAIPYASAKELCAVAALDAWLEAAGITTGRIFAVTDQTVARVVQRAAKDAGLDHKPFAGHSLRAGFVTTASCAGAPLDSIMRQTGHRSVDVVMGYIRMANAFKNNAAVGLV